MKWYSLRVISGKEKSIKENIMYDAEEQKMDNFIGEIFVPYEKVVVMKQNKKKIKEKLFFPGYILINMELNSQTRYMIENTNGVISFVGPKKGEPVPLRDEEIKRIFGEIERKDGRETVEVSFLKGDSVKIINGPCIMVLLLSTSKKSRSKTFKIFIMDIVTIKWIFKKVRP